MPTDDRDQPVTRPRPQTWMEMLADRLDPPKPPEGPTEGAHPAAPTSGAMSDERED